MKRLNVMVKVLAVSLLIYGLWSCEKVKKEEFTPAQNEQKLLLAALESDLELSQFTEQFRSLDLSASSATGFTILAVKNGALKDGITAGVLKRHILEKAYTPSDLSEAGKVKSLGGDQLVVKTTEGIVALNNTPIGTHKVVGSSTLFVLDEVIHEDNKFLGIKSEFSVDLSRVLPLRPEVIELEDATFEWTQEFKGENSVVSKELNYDFITLVSGEYHLSIQATSPNGKTLMASTTVTVAEPEEELKPNPVRVLDFVPAPGLNQPEEFKTKQIALDKAFEQMKGGGGNLYLGAFGGYLIVGFDHTIMNRPGYCDFTTQYGGGDTNISPSTIWVAYDANGNGNPDDEEWYEIKGSEHGGDNDLGMQTYTYKTKKDEGGYAWTTQSGESGLVADEPPFVNIKIAPWLADAGETFTLSGRQLKPVKKEGNMFGEILPFAWGYACNQPNNSNQAAIDIDWAIDKDGNSVHLPGVDFIKVINAIQGMRPYMGEYRYQVKAIQDLHLLSKEITTEEAQSGK